jgi:hypothetical protein
MEGHLTYKIGEVDRQFFFGNYALEQTLNHFDALVSDLHAIEGKQLLGNQLLPFLRIMMFHAASYPILKKGEIVDFTNFDVYEWIDLSGGTGGDLVITVSKIVFTVLGMNTEVTEQKKSKQES